MADVFLSYSRGDRQRVEPIARGLEVEGYSVWWDPDIRPGETWDEVIERELAAARCVVVAWSETAVQSKWVRSEATDADERRILVPVRLDTARLPLAFKLIQAEDFRVWVGDRNADGWQRLMLQVTALAGERREQGGQTPGTSSGGQTLGSDPMARAGLGSGASQAIGIAEAKDRVDGARGQTRGSDPTTGSGTTTLLTVSALGILVAAWMFGAADRSAVLTTTVVLAALAFVLFRLAEDDLSPGMKAIARRWMLPVEGKVQVSAIEAFNAMFEAVFGRRHWSWFCFWRSALASIVGFAMCLVLAWYFSPTPFVEYLLADPQKAMFALGIYGGANIFGDWISLWETRVLLKWASLSTWRLPVAIILDAILTALLFLMAAVAVAIAFLIVAVLFGILPRLSQAPEGLEFVAFASIATAYLTSIWLWLALIFTPIVRLVVWSRTRGLTAIGRLLDAERKPMVALGYVTALIILAAGGLAWGLGHAVAAMPR